MIKKLRCGVCFGATDDFVVGAVSATAVMFFVISHMPADTASTTGI